MRITEVLPTERRALPDEDPDVEVIDTVHSLDRVLAEDVRAPHPLPEFSRSTVDGYAVRARDTFGVSESFPGYLTLVGEVPMGDTPNFEIAPGMCALIHTGGMLPRGADAVIMLEYAQLVYYEEDEKQEGKINKGLAEPVYAPMNTEIELSRPVAEGENMLHIGEDVMTDQVVLSTGDRVRPAEIGGCMALGIMKLRVAIKPKIGIISCGDELVSPEQTPHPGQVRDVIS